MEAGEFEVKKKYKLRSIIFYCGFSNLSIYWKTSFHINRTFCVIYFSSRG